jgi:hypothetical protein
LLALTLSRRLTGLAGIFMENDILSLYEMKAIWDANEDSFGMMKDAAKIGYYKGRIAEAEKNDRAQLRMQAIKNTKEWK